MIGEPEATRDTRTPFGNKARPLFVFFGLCLYMNDHWKRIRSSGSEKNQGTKMMKYTIENQFPSNGKTA